MKTKKDTRLSDAYDAYISTKKGATFLTKVTPF